MSGWRAAWLQRRINTNVPHQRSEVTWRRKNPSQEVWLAPSGQALHWHNLVITGMSLVADQYSQIHTDGSKQGFASWQSSRVQLIWKPHHLPWIRQNRQYLLTNDQWQQFLISEIMFKVHGSKDLEMRLEVKIAFLAKCFLNRKSKTNRVLGLTGTKQAPSSGTTR